MIENSSLILYSATASVAFFHTILGVDHYLPIAAFSRSNSWSFKKTFWVTLLCSFFHLSGSVVIGGLAIFLGFQSKNLLMFNNIRGQIAGYSLLIFGLIYLIWALKNAFYQSHKHTHYHLHLNGILHRHEHKHKEKKHRHVHRSVNRFGTWFFFVVFILGPCEPLIPLLIFPTTFVSQAVTVTTFTIFSLTTILTMLSAVAIVRSGLTFKLFQNSEKYIHIFSGSIVALSGAAILFLGV